MGFGLMDTRRPRSRCPRRGCSCPVASDRRPCHELAWYRGAVIGGWLWALLFDPQEGVPWIASIVTAVVLLAICRRIAYGRRRVV
jgi:hypothetical protein